MAAAAAKNVGDDDGVPRTTGRASTLTPVSPTDNNPITPAPAPASASGPTGEYGYDGGRYAIEIPPAAAADDARLVDRLVRMVNEVYAGAEAGIWRDGFQRTSAPEVEGMIRAGELAVAYLYHGHDNHGNPDTNDDNNARGSSGGDAGVDGAAPSRQSEPIGCVCIKELPGAATFPTGDSDDVEIGGGEAGGTGEFGMLALDAAHRGGGLGRAMVRFVEDRCRSGLGLGTVRLELLFPTRFQHAFKVRLEGW